MRSLYFEKKKKDLLVKRKNFYIISWNFIILCTFKNSTYEWHQKSFIYNSKNRIFIVYKYPLAPTIFSYNNAF